MNKIVFATGNQHKVEEINRINRRIQFLSLHDVDINEEIPETGSSFAENAYQKASYVFNKTKLPVLAEDSGLIVDALDGRPGIYSARYAGLQKNHQDNIAKVLHEMKGIADRRAKFISCLCFIDNTGQSSYFEGFCHGFLFTQPLGNGGFGYDPIFIPNGYDKSFGELPNEIKDKISHRSKSFEIFSNFLKENFK